MNLLPTPSAMFYLQFYIFSKHPVSEVGNTTDVTVTVTATALLLTILQCNRAFWFDSWQPVTAFWIWFVLRNTMAITVSPLF